MVIVDSFGHLYREQIDMLYAKYRRRWKDSGKEIGIHAHNNMQLAIRQYTRGDHLGRKSCRCHDDGTGPRGGQLSDGALARLLA